MSIFASLVLTIIFWCIPWSWAKEWNRYPQVKIWHYTVALLIILVLGAAAHPGVPLVSAAFYWFYVLGRFIYRNRVHILAFLESTPQTLSHSEWRGLMVKKGLWVATEHSGHTYTFSEKPRFSYGDFHGHEKTFIGMTIWVGDRSNNGGNCAKL